LLLEINRTPINPPCALVPRDLPVLVHCAHAHANLGGFHLSWNEPLLYRSARLRPQLNPRGPTACGHRRFERARQLWIRGETSLSWLLATYTPGRILGWTPDAHSANVCIASCAYAAERIGRSIEEKALWDWPVFLKRPDSPTRWTPSVLEGRTLFTVHPTS
jgi:hypothetical protein